MILNHGKLFAKGEMDHGEMVGKWEMYSDRGGHKEVELWYKKGRMHPKAVKIYYSTGELWIEQEWKTDTALTSEYTHSAVGDSSLMQVEGAANRYYFARHHENGMLAVEGEKYYASIRYIACGQWTWYDVDGNVMRTKNREPELERWLRKRQKHRR